MDLTTLASAVLLGIVQGLTEFIPVSSTGHLILFVDLIGFRGPPGKVFEIVIQLGSILAVCWVFHTKLTDVARGLRSQPESRRFVANILIAFTPAMVVGAMAHDFITTVLFDPRVVAITLILGGLAIMAIERGRGPSTLHAVEEMPARTALLIGLCQTFALIPGVSRSGATIMGALLVGVDRKTATEFSFFLAIPTMFAATVYDVYANWSALSGHGLMIIAVGSVAAFLSAMVVVRSLVGFVGRHGFTPFAWYRIVLGLGLLVYLYS
jgi:undecaprenyl-diphosphatase